VGDLQRRGLHTGDLRREDERDPEALLRSEHVTDCAIDVRDREVRGVGPGDREARSVTTICPALAISTTLVGLWLPIGTEPNDTDAGLAVKNGCRSPMPVSKTGAGGCALLDAMVKGYDTGPSATGRNSMKISSSCPAAMLVGAFPGHLETRTDERIRDGQR